MAAIATPIQSPSKESQEDQVMDTRTPSPLPRTGNSAETMEYKPDLSQEVAMLSTKLVNAINFQTTLDDQLQQTRHELEMSKRQFAKLQAEKKYLDEMIRDGILVRKSDVNPIIESLTAELSAENIAREAAERSKKQTEAELENLTSALFEEANKMVAAARKDSEAAAKRNSQLQSRLSDTQVLLASQQEQLQDLKLTMERMSERGDNDTTRNSVPSTPVNPQSGLFDGLPMSSSQSVAPEMPPEHPLFFSSLLVPVLRNDVTAYNDFQDLLQAARKAAGHLRSSSSGNPSQNALEIPNSIGQLTHFSGSSPNLPGAFSFSTSSSPNTSQTFATPPIPLKDSKFYKRSLVEDIEPTLRLDLAPGLSFLSRRGVLSSLLQGSLIVEPFVPGSKFVGPIYACALCGESRKPEHYQRKHRFKTSDDESAQRYPLCDYCLGRIRASGDFITFLRMVRDGHWRADTEEEQKNAWEESVRLRERMFWARVGGGVIPAAAMRNTTPSTSAIKSPRQSFESISHTKADGLALSPQEETERFPPREAEPISPQEDSGPPSAAGSAKRVPLESKLVEVFQRHRKSLSMGRALDLDGTPSMQELGIGTDAGGTMAKPRANAEEVGMSEDGTKTVEVTQMEPQQNNDTEERRRRPPPPAVMGDIIDSHPLETIDTTVPTRASITRSTTSETSTSRAPSVAASERRVGRPTSVADRAPSLASRPTSSSTAASRSPDRKQSGVLARVRAMEAQSQSK